MGVGVGVGVGLGVGVGVGEGDGVGVGDGDAEAVAIGEGAGAGEPASSATDGTPHPARPAQAAMARAADADLTTILWRPDISTPSRLPPARDESKEPGRTSKFFIRTSPRKTKDNTFCHVMPHSTRRDMTGHL